MLMKPQLTLRDLFWLVLVSAVSVGWWVDRQSYVPRRVSPEVLERDYPYLLVPNTERRKEIR